MAQRHTKIATKLTLGFSAVLLLTLAVGASGFIGLAVLNKTITQSAQDQVPKIMALGEWEVSLVRSASHMRSFLILHSPEAITKELAKTSGELDGLVDVLLLASVDTDNDRWREGEGRGGDSFGH